MSILFEPYTIRNMEIRNRFMRSATTSAFAESDGTVNDAIIRIYERLAKGEVGLIVKGHLYVSDTGKAHDGMAGISSDSHIPGLKKLTDVVHSNGGKIVAQINHAGVVHEQGRAGPSAYSEDNWSAREMMPDEIDKVIAEFGDAAERALTAGFDGVQIHGAHGYLVSQFLSRLTNKRTDKWGGTLMNRMRFLNEVYDEVRGRVGNNPVLIKLNCDDFSPNGFTINDSVQVAKSLSERGIDLIEVSGGGRGEISELRSRAKSGDADFSELAFAGYAKKIREATIPTKMALVYGFKSLSVMEKAVSSGLTDIISMSRPFISEPDLVKKLRSGQTEVRCVRCDECDKQFGKEIMTCILQ
jgi:2,4-dienoyl-CoA reductase-like NADH-dependent reductase (Old Yellow Enzyme family)